MTREEIKKEYRVIAGIIVSRGKYQGEPVYVPYYALLVIEGLSDRVESDDLGAVDPTGDTYIFEIDASDVEMWPELAGVKTLRLWQDDTGLVRHGIERARVIA